MKIVSIVGNKNSGKTSLTTKLIRELTKRGYNVASVKHSHHNIEMDKPNTDTWRHKQAGANLVVGIGSTTFFNVKEEYDLNRILYLIKHLGNFDFVIIEGFKKYNYPKIATSPEIVDEYTIKEVNSFEADYEMINELADLIEERGHDIVDTLFLNTCGHNNGEEIAHEILKGNIKTDELDEVYSYLSINNKIIGLNRFVSDYIKQTLVGIINSLHIKEYGVDSVDKIELLINNEEKIVDSSIKKSDITINSEKIEINKFVKSIVANSIIGIVKSLQTNKKAENIQIDIENIENNDIYNANVSLIINDEIIKINEFVKGILKESIFGILKTLHIDDEIKDVKIDVEIE